MAKSLTYLSQTPALLALQTAALGTALRVLVTLGPGPDGSSFDVPGDPVVVASARHDLMMRQAVVVVTHRSHGTAMFALANGCPWLCLPMRRDQNDNAARGAGIRLTRDADVAGLRTTLATLSDSSSFVPSAKVP